MTKIETYDQPILDLLKKEKYRSIPYNKNLNPFLLIRDFLIDLELVDDWVKYYKMRWDLEKIVCND